MIGKSRRCGASWKPSTAERETARAAAPPTKTVPSIPRLKRKDTANTRRSPQKRLCRREEEGEIIE